MDFNVSNSLKELYQVVKEPNGKIVYRHHQLVEWGARWLRKHQSNILVPNCTTILTETSTANKTGEIPDIIGWCSWASVMIEVKVSREDFLKDSKKYFRKDPKNGVGNFRYYLVPEEGIIKRDELPESWGLLQMNQVGDIEIVRKAEKIEPNLESERAMLLSFIRRSKAS